MAAHKSPAISFIPLCSGPVVRGLVFCVAVLPSSTNVGQPFILLRSGLATRVYLGASVDAAQRVVEWLEIWVQSVAGLADSPATWRDYLSNAELDAQWSAEAMRFTQLCPAASRHIGCESSHPEPLFVDLSQGKPWLPKDPASGQPFLLCTDDAKLTAAGLPSYSRSLHRYWLAGNPDARGGSTWVAVTPGAPTGPAVLPLEQVVVAHASVFAFNPEGGLMQVRRLAPVGVEDYVELLAGRPWKGLAAGQECERLSAPYNSLGDWDELLHHREHFFLGGRGRVGVFLEAFHLKLHAIYQMMKLTAEAVKQRQLPMLNITAETFRVELGPAAPAAPLLWTARVTMAVPGQAVALPLKDTGLQHFLPLAAPVTTIYRPDYLGLPVRGRGMVRLRRVGVDASGQVFVEGTLITQERLRLTPSDLIWLKLPLVGTVVDLFGNLDQEGGMAAGESRFRTAPQRMDPVVAKQLRAGEGNAFDGTMFETIPMLSSPCDLYALGVLAVRALLVNAENSLGVALDETLSLARQMGLEAEGDAVAKVRQLVASDSRWLATLGPHRLSHETLTPETALNWLPEDLWWRTVAAVARFFPGQGKDSYCRDFADFSPFAIERVFAAPLAEMEELLRLSRGLIFSDWVANREVAGVLAQIRP
jgi:hypothetical protein